MLRWPTAAIVAMVAHLFVLAAWALAHPGSGIVADARGNIYFVDTGHGIWRIDPQGRLSHAYPSTGHHWLAIDPAGSFSHADFKQWSTNPAIPHFLRVTAEGETPTLIGADGQPFVVALDGNLYYARGNLEIMRLSPGGKVTPLVLGMAAQADKLGGIKGLGCAADGSLLAAYPSAIQRITMDGKTSLVIHPITVPGCTGQVDPAMENPYLRGLAIGADGATYAAATNCRRVLKITADGKITTVLTSPAPWTPTGVAVSKNIVYVLEYHGDPHSETDPSFPRVTRVGPDGKETVLAEFTATLSPR